MLVFLEMSGLLEKPCFRSISVGTITLHPKSARIFPIGIDLSLVSPQKLSGIISGGGMATIWAIGFPFGSINKPSPCRPSTTCQRILRILYCLFSKISAGLLRVSRSSKSSVILGESIIPKIFFKVSLF